MFPPRNFLLSYIKTSPSEPPGLHLVGGYGNFDEDEDYEETFESSYIMDQE
jgi:hypothetical protein